MLFHIDYYKKDIPPKSLLTQSHQKTIRSTKYFLMCQFRVEVVLYTNHIQPYSKCALLFAFYGILPPV